MRIFGVILAGGTGRRMGGTDKSALLLGAQPLLARVIDRLEPQVEQLAIKVGQLDGGAVFAAADLRCRGYVS